MIRVELTPEDIKLAESKVFINISDYTGWMNNRDGNLGEIAFCKLIGQEWVGRDSADAGIDVFWKLVQQTIQVKTVRDEPWKRKIYIQQEDKKFDYYALIFLAQDLSYADIVWIADKSTLECNAVVDSDGLKHVWYK